MYSYIFPRAVHVDEFGLRDQLKKINSEVGEVRSAYASPYIGQVGVELYDVIHSAETGLRMMEEHFGLNVRALGSQLPANQELSLYHQIKRLSWLSDLLGRAFDGNSSRDVAMALMRVIGGAESALVILAEVYHVDVDACRRNVFLKNDARGYYAGVPRGPDGQLPGFFALHDLARIARPTTPLPPQEESRPC